MEYVCNKPGTLFLDVSDVVPYATKAVCLVEQILYGTGVRTFSGSEYCLAAGKKSSHSMKGRV